MDKGLIYVIYIMVFASGFMIMQAAIMGGREASKKVRLANARLRRIEGGQPHMAVIEKMRKSTRLNADSEFKALFNWINKLSMQAGVKVEASWVISGTVALGLICPVLTYLLTQNIFYSFASISAAGAPVFILRFLRKRRSAKLGRQLPESLDVIIRSLGAGHPVPVAMNMVGREMADPIGSEFGTATDEITFGASLGEGVQRMSERVGHPDFHLFAATIRLQERTGGNLAELLRANAKTIRDRQRMRLKIKAASAEGRMSAIILNIAPLVLYIFVRLISPDFYGDVADDPLVNYGLGFAVVWMTIGNLVMKKMIAFRI